MINNFSPNMLKTYQSCPKKYYFKYVENINIPQSYYPFEKGKKIHALANYSLQGIKTDRIETALTVVEKEIWESLKQNSFYQKDCFKSEFQLSCKISDYWIGGRIDAVVHDFDKYYILDYKTGVTPQNAQYDYQTMVYLLCMDMYLKEYESLSFVYINLKENKNYLIQFSDNIKKQYVNKVSDMCSKIFDDRLYKCNRENCKFCEYLKICN